MPQIREQIAMVHLPPSKTLKYLFHVRKTKSTQHNAECFFSDLIHTYLQRITSMNNSRDFKKEYDAFLQKVPYQTAVVDNVKVRY